MTRLAEPRAAATGPAEARYAGVVSRGLAFVIDATIVVVSTTIAIVMVDLVAAALGAGPRELARVLAPVLAAAPPTLMVVYFTALWTLAGRTPGMALLGLRVVRPDGRQLSLGRALVRALVLVILLIGALWSLIDRRHQGLHDKVAGTVVVYDSP